MTTKTNIQRELNQENSTKANDDKEMKIMTPKININGSDSLASQNRKTNRFNNLFAGLIIGGMMMAASILPGAASADSPARSASDDLAYSVTATTGATEVDSWVSLTYQPKLVQSNIVSPEVDAWTTLTYSEKLVASKFASPFDAPDADDLATVIRGEKLVRSNAFSAMNVPEVDD